MSKFFYIIFLCPFLCWAQIAKSQGQNEEEALFLNRIADFWEEGEYLIAKNQIQEFLTLYPNSSFSDSLCAAIGDLLLREKNYASAIDYYAKISTLEVASRTFPHRMQCLYAMQWYAILADECEAFLASHNENFPEHLQITYYLAVALYHQCLNAANDQETLIRLAKRAEPYFETLLHTSLKPDVAAAFAHLLCILKEFPKAASTYMDLAKSENSHESLFQAALIQAEYDKELSLKTFQTIALDNQETTIQQEAAYNCLVLSFDLQKYKEMIDTKDRLEQTIPPSRLDSAHLLIGRAYFALQNYPEAIAAFDVYLATEPVESDTLRSVLASLIDASVQTQNLDSLNRAIAKMESIYPNDKDLLTGKFSKARLLLQQNKPTEAQQELESLLVFPNEQIPEVLVELIYVNDQMQAWDACRTNALRFLSLFSNHDQTLIVRRYLIRASSEIAKTCPEGKRQLIRDLQNILNGEEPLNEEMKNSWQFLLAKTFFSLNEYKEALPLLLDLTKQEDIDSEMLGKTNMLLALCYRDGLHDLQNFSLFGEKALTLKSTSIDEGSLHAALYNAYLELSHVDLKLLEKAEEHLFAAFQKETPIATENILWLADRYLTQNKIEEGALLLESIKQSDKCTNEEIQVHLSKLYYQIHKYEQATSLLENLIQLYQASPSYNWKHKNETLLLLGEIYTDSGFLEKAKNLFDVIIREKSNLKTLIGASASLQSARLQARAWNNQIPSIDNLQFQQVISQLKDLVLQKNISHEPIYLEAALDYIDLQNRCASELNPYVKKLTLLQKTKRDFENSDDLLSKDYHSGRKGSPNLDFIYQSYMKFLDAEILNAESNLKTEIDEQKELQAKAKDLLLKVVEEKAHPALVARANRCLNQ